MDSELPSPEQRKHKDAVKRTGMRSHHGTPGRSDTCTSQPGRQAASSNRPSEPGRSPGPSGSRLTKPDSHLFGVPKRARPWHDVDGPSTSHLPVKKRRLQHRLVTSRLSRPYSMPATHILNRYASSSGSDTTTPVRARVLKAAKWWGHQTAQVRKAAILNRVRRGVRQAAGARGHDRMWRFAGVQVLGHGLQLVTGETTGAMFPGRGSGDGPVPRAWRPHTTGVPGAFGPGPGPGNGGPDTKRPLSTLPGKQASSHPHALPSLLPQPPAAPEAEAPPSPPRTLIMTPLGGDDNLDEIAAFPAAELEGRYADLSDDDMDDVYANFAEMLGGNADGARSPFGEGGFGGEKGDADVFYEEYLDGLDGITWVS